MKWPRWRTSTRGLMVAVAATAVPLALYAHLSRQTPKERAVAEIRRLGGGVLGGVAVGVHDPPVTVTLGGSVTDAYLAGIPLEALPTVRYLYLESPITDEGLKSVAKLTGLEQLFLYSARITGPGLDELRRLPKLEHLSLNYGGFTDAGLAHMKGLNALESLGLAHTGVTDAGLAHLATLPALRSLGLAHTGVTDAGLAHLAALPALESVDLDDTAVTEAGVLRLRGLPHLRSVTVPAEISYEVAGRLRRAMPGVGINGGGPSPEVMSLMRPHPAIPAGGAGGGDGPRTTDPPSGATPPAATPSSPPTSP